MFEDGDEREPGLEDIAEMPDLGRVPLPERDKD